MFSLSLSLASLALLFFVNKSHHAPTDQLQQPDSNAVDGPVSVPEIEKPMAQINNPLTSHILDTTLGLPAANVRCVLYKMGANGAWSQVLERLTDHDGRLKSLLTDAEFTPGIYKFYFDTKGYYESLRTATFYPYVEIVFEITNPKQHYHVPLLLSPYGYSTYRGS